MVWFSPSRHWLLLVPTSLFLLFGQASKAQDTPLLHIDVVGPNRAAWNGDESRIVVCHFQDWRYWTTVYDAASGQAMFSVVSTDRKNVLSSCPEWQADRLMTVVDGEVEVWDANTGERMLSLEGGDVLDAWWGREPDSHAINRGATVGMGCGTARRD
jgi:hypothetical protein